MPYKIRIISANIYATKGIMLNINNENMLTTNKSAEMKLISIN